MSRLERIIFLLIVLFDIRRASTSSGILPTLAITVFQGIVGSVD
jgi:hypothetical protein